MSLSCSCDDWCPEPGQVVVEEIKFDETLKTKRSRKCCACGTKISPGSQCHKIIRGKIPELEVEIRIYGEDGVVPRAPFYWCEECGDLHEAVSALGFCAPINDNPRDLIKQWREEFGNATRKLYSDRR